MTVERRPITDQASWHQWRSGVVTASDIGAAAGVDDYKSTLQLHLEKTGKRLPASDTPLMRRGRLFEPAVMAYIADEIPTYRMVRPKVFLLDAEARLGATPDLLLEDPEAPEQLINCQMKVVAGSVYARWAVDSYGMAIPPMPMQLQVTQESMLLDAHSGLLAVLVVSEFDAHLELFTVPRHPAAEARIRQTALEFWDRIERGVLPAADYRIDAEVLRDLYPPDKAVPAPLDLTSDNRIGTLLEAYEAAKATQKGAAAEIEVLKGEIIEKLKGAELALATGWKITRKMQHRNGYTVDPVDFPDLRVHKLKDAA